MIILEQENCMYRAWLQAECVGALVHAVVLILVSIFITKQSLLEHHAHYEQYVPCTYSHIDKPKPPALSQHFGARHKLATSYFNRNLSIFQLSMHYV